MAEGEIEFGNNGETKPKRGNPAWVKGVSGNPSGRPAVAREFKEKCREFMREEGWQHLVNLARTKGKDQRYALELIAHYAYGKPTQPIAGDDEFEPLRILIESPGGETNA